MAFQDFDQITERRRAERQQRIRKRIIVGAVSAFVFVVLVAGAGFAIASNFSHVGTQPAAQTHDHQHGTTGVSHVSRVIKMVCNSTDYEQQCENTLTKAVKENPNLSQPKDLLKTTILAIAVEIEKAMTKTKTFKFNTPSEKAAFEDCKVLVKDAMEELIESASKVGNNSLASLSSTTPDLNNWLSAVMSYQQTCIDGFPKGKLKNDMEKFLKVSKELTSNSLAMISELSSFLSTFQVPGPSRHLLTQESSSPTMDNDGFPTWMTPEDRRMLKGKADKPKPNVIVAKDGSGDYKTISGALAAMPEKYKGRYVIYVKEGIYEETVTVTKKMVNVTMYGDGSRKSIIAGSKNFVDGLTTFKTATFVTLGEGFIGKAMGFRNAAGPKKAPGSSCKSPSRSFSFHQLSF